MEFFKSNTPVYKTASFAKKAQHAQPMATSNGLSGLIGSLFGTATPAYKTADGRAAKASASSGLLSMFAAAPSYRVAQSADLAEPVLDGDVIADEVAQAEDPGLDDDGSSCVADEIVLL
ncbi:MAG: hypothetical protein SFX73_17800 [Kofleriaceae bacterium]|nr:hypothetical protein [Kofleriaceae bacterium]